MAKKNGKPNFRQGKVTQGIFDAVKILLQSNDNISEIAKFMKLSWDTVRMIRDSETLAEYKQKMYLKSGYYRQKVAKEEKAKQEKEKQEKLQKAEAVAKEVGAVPASELIPEKPVETRQTIVVQASHYMLEEQKKTNELLTLISNKLAFLLDELTK